MNNKTKFCQIIGLLRIEKVVYKRKRVPFIGRPFVKRFALCYQTVVCLSCLSVCLSLTLVYCGQTVGRIKMKLGMRIVLGPADFVLDENPAPPPKRRHSPRFSAHICCGQMPA